MMNRVYEQRIGIAVEAALSGETITFRLDGGDPTYLTWLADGRRRHVISAGTRRAMEAMLPEAQAEFQRRLLEASEASETDQGERGMDAASVAN